MNNLWRKLIILSCIGAQTLFLHAADGLPDDAAIQAILHDRIGVAKKGVGIVAGILDENGTRIVSDGIFSATDARKVDGGTLFEIGSMSKVFTSTLLANAVERGEVKLDDPISKYLPASVKVPSRNGRQITLVDLATHRSGLPRLPENLSMADPANPYADYTVEQLYEFLSHYELTRDVGAEYEYSNLGMGLLGHILALKAGTNYEALVEQIICRPLGMTSTAITLSPDLKKRLARGHNEMNAPVANWDLPTLAGAGALRSTAGDLLKFAAANLGLVKSGLEPAFNLAHTPRQEAGSKLMHIGLAWHIATRFDHEIVWHNGGTGGYRSFLGLDKKQHRAVVVLANSANSIDDIGFHLLDAQYKLADMKPGSSPQMIAVDGKILDDYRGRYEMSPGTFMDVRRAGDHLQIRLTGQPYADVFPKTETEFFYTVVKASVTFEKDGTGRIVELTLHQNGADLPAKKISNDIPADAPVKKHVAIAMDPARYDAYVGRYELTPGAVFTIKREGARLLAQLTGQPFVEIFPEAEGEFFYKVVDAQLSFKKDANGKVTSLTLHQNGANQPAKKIDNRGQENSGSL